MTRSSPRPPALALPGVDFLRLDAKTGHVLIDIHVMPNAPQTGWTGCMARPANKP